MNVSLLILVAFLLLAIWLGIQARRGKTMDLEQWSTGGRSFGSVLVFLLCAGEIYTTFTFLGASGWAYGKGGGAFYILCYFCLAYILSYWLLPAIWRYGNAHGLVSQSDFFVSKYGSRTLGVLISIIGIVAMIPYLVLQFKGLGIIVSQASYGMISPATAIWIGAISISLYVMISGVHGSAWTAVVKDTLVLAVVIFIGLYLPYHYFGGIGDMFRSVEATQPGFLKLPDVGLNPYWFSTTVLMSAIGFYTWPHAFVMIYTAKKEKVFRQNAVLFPLYQLLLLFVFFVGFAAVAQVPGLKGAQTDLALLSIVKQTFDPWLVGVIGAAGLMCALVPGSMILMTAATLLAKNVYGVFRPQTSDQSMARLARMLVPVVALISVYCTFQGGQTIVALLLVGYGFVTQFFPALVFSLAKKNPLNTPGVIVGLIVGVLLSGYMSLKNVTLGMMMPFLPVELHTINNGVVALIANLCIALIVSQMTRRSATQLTTERTIA